METGCHLDFCRLFAYRAHLDVVTPLGGRAMWSATSGAQPFPPTNGIQARSTLAMCGWMTVKQVPASHGSVATALHWLSGPKPEHSLRGHPDIVESREGPLLARVPATHRWPVNWKDG